VGLGGAIAGSALVSSHPAVAGEGSGVVLAPDLVINPRERWGSDLVAGPLRVESDVRFLLVHHTAGSNTYGLDGVPAQMRQVFEFHTGPEKRWPDVAYNFFVDRFGGVWEGRTGSLSGPVMADATGGSQGFAQLVCLLGNFVDADPTTEMLSSLERVLAWLADRHSIDTSSGATTSFTSRGSNRWRAGSNVTVRTISGHRDVSQTACPGDRMYARLVAEVPDAVTGWRGTSTSPAVASTAAAQTTAVPTTRVPTTAASTTRVPTSQVPTSQVPTSQVPTTTNVGATTVRATAAQTSADPTKPTVTTTAAGTTTALTTASTSLGASAGKASGTDGQGRGDRSLLFGAGALVVGGLAAGAIAIRRRRTAEIPREDQFDES
jgi:hypothetical protein